MAAALPVAAFQSPVHREYLAGEGFYAPLGDAAGLAAAIAQALDSPELSQRGLRLRACVIQRYTWQHAARQIEDVYHHLAGIVARVL